MDTKKFLFGTLTGTIVGFAMGFLIFGMALSNYLPLNAEMKDPPEFLWLILGHVSFAAMVTYIFLKWAGIKTSGSGAKAGAIIAFLFASSFDLIYLGTTNLFPGIEVIIVDVLAGTVVWTIGGAAIGWALGRGDTV